MKTKTDKHFSVFFRRYLVLLVILSSSVGTAEEMILSGPSLIYTTPSDKSASVGTLPKGKRVFVVEGSEGFRRLRSRAGKPLWVRQTQLEPPHAAYNLLADVEGEFPSHQEFKRIRLDFGVSGGSAEGDSFLEGALGVEYFMMERLSLRTAVFFRRAPGHTDFGGLDISTRGNGNLPLGALKLRGILGAGFRFTTLAGHNAPFAEVGGFATIWGFDVGFLAKYLISTAPFDDEVVYSVVLSGNTGFL